MSLPLGMNRIIDLMYDLADDHIVLGPLDREDLRTLLAELLERRNDSAQFIGNESAKVADCAVVS